MFSNQKKWLGDFLVQNFRVLLPVARNAQTHGGEAFQLLHRRGIFVGVQAAEIVEQADHVGKPLANTRFDELLQAHFGGAL